MANHVMQVKEDKELTKSCARCGNVCDCTEVIVFRNNPDYASGYMFCCKACKGILVKAEVMIAEALPKPKAKPKKEAKMSHSKVSKSYGSKKSGTKRTVKKPTTRKKPTKKKSK